MKQLQAKVRADEPATSSMRCTRRPTLTFTPCWNATTTRRRWRVHRAAPHFKEPAASSATISPPPTPGDAGSDAERRIWMDGVVHRHTSPHRPGHAGGRAPCRRGARLHPGRVHGRTGARSCMASRSRSAASTSARPATPGSTSQAGRAPTCCATSEWPSICIRWHWRTCSTANQRSKLDLYERQGFVVLNDPSYEDRELRARQVSIFFGEQLRDLLPRSQGRTSSSRCAIGVQTRRLAAAHLRYRLSRLCAGRSGGRPQVPADRGAVERTLEELEDEALDRPTDDTLRTHPCRRGARWSPSIASNGPSARRCWR